MGLGVFAAAIQFGLFELMDRHHGVRERAKNMAYACMTCGIWLMVDMHQG